jgi:hypothetical protein
MFCRRQYAFKLVEDCPHPQEQGGEFPGILEDAEVTSTVIVPAARSGIRTPTHCPCQNSQWATLLREGTLDLFW